MRNLFNKSPIYETKLVFYYMKNGSKAFIHSSASEASTCSGMLLLTIRSYYHRDGQSDHKKSVKLAQPESLLADETSPLCKTHTYATRS